MLNAMMGISGLEPTYEAVKLGRGRQFVIKSNRAFDRMIFEGYETAWSNKIYTVRSMRYLNTMKKAAKLFTEDTGSRTQEIYLEQILEQELKPSDPLLR